MSFVDQAEKDTLTFWFRPGDAAPTRPGALYLALFSADPTDAGSVANELANATSPGYARTAVTFDDPQVRAGDIVNSADVTFPNPSADWVEATHVAVCKSNVAGTADLIAVLQLTAPIQALTNEPIRFNAGQLNFAQD